MKLNDANRGIVKFKKTKRLGRGIGSGQGKTAGRGHKGQGSRVGWQQPHTFQGGMSPLVRRIPKRGFNNAYALSVGIVNVGDLDAAYQAGEEVNAESLKTKDLLKGRFDVIKVLGNGELTKKLTIAAHRFSASAREKIEKAGGQLTLLPERTPVEEKKQAAKAARQAGSPKKGPPKKK
jgi:large subunit ribosomal protein L15